MCTPAQTDGLRARLEFLHSMFDLFRHLLPPLTIQEKETEENLAAQDRNKFIPNFKRARQSVTKCLGSIKRMVATSQLGKSPPDGRDGVCYTAYFILNQLTEVLCR